MPNLIVASLFLIAASQAIINDEVCRSKDGTLLPSATSCPNVHDDDACTAAYPDNDPVNLMEVGNKNPRRSACYTSVNTTETESNIRTKLDALARCPKRCGYCCVDAFKMQINEVFNCHRVSPHLCHDMVVGKLLRRFCPEKCQSLVRENDLSIRK